MLSLSRISLSRLHIGDSGLLDVLGKMTIFKNVYNYLSNEDNKKFKVVLGHLNFKQKHASRCKYDSALPRFNATFKGQRSHWRTNHEAGTHTATVQDRLNTNVVSYHQGSSSLCSSSTELN